MSDQSDDSNRPPKVGYGRPPRHTQFKPGQSGNPRGRPRGARNRERDLERFSELFSKEADRQIVINEPDGAKRMSMAQAIFRSIAVNAARGRIGAQRLFTETCSNLENAKAERFYAAAQAVFEYKAAWENEFHQRKLLGVTGPEPDLHPDNLQIDFNTNEITEFIPFTEDQRRIWTNAFNNKDAWEKELKFLEEQAADPNCEYRVIIEGELEQARRMVAVLRKMFPTKINKPKS